MNHFIPYNKTNKVVNTKFFKEVVCLHGFTKAITSDINTQFSSNFLWTSCHKLGNMFPYSYAYLHPQIDVWTKVVNGSDLGNFLWSIVVDWWRQQDLTLLQAKSSYNYSVKETTIKWAFLIIQERNQKKVVDLMEFPIDEHINKDSKLLAKHDQEVQS